MMTASSCPLRCSYFIIIHTAHIGFFVIHTKQQTVIFAAISPISMIAIISGWMFSSNLQYFFNRQFYP